MLIEDDVFIGTNVTFANHNTTVNFQGIDAYEQTIIKEGDSVGAT